VGWQDGQTNADRHEYDGLTFMHRRVDENGTVRAAAQQPDYQEVSMRASKSQSSLYIRSDSKAADVNIVEIVHESPGGDQKFFAVDGDGETQITNLAVGPAPLELLSDQMEVRATLEHNGLKFYDQDPNQAGDNFNMRVRGTVWMECSASSWTRGRLRKATTSQSAKGLVPMRKSSTSCEATAHGEFPPKLLQSDSRVGPTPHRVVLLF
jgi:hypothetical protein